MLTEIKNSVKAKLYDSTNSPFLSSYIVSFILYNHKYILIYFGNFEDKLSLLEANGLAWDGIIAPVLFALSYVYVYPYLLKFFYRYTLQRQKERIDIKQEIEDKQLLTTEQSREVRSAQNRLEKEIDRKDNKIEYFKKEINALEINKNKIEDAIAKKFLVKEEKIRIEEENKYKNTMKIFQSELDKQQVMLSEKNTEIEIYKKSQEKLQLTIKERDNYCKISDDKNKKLAEELNKIKQNNKQAIDKKYQKYLKEFSVDELKILETIYKNDIENHNKISNFISQISQHTKMPIIRTEKILESLEKKGYAVTDNMLGGSGLTESGKSLAYEMCRTD